MKCQAAVNIYGYPLNPDKEGSPQGCSQDDDYHVPPGSIGCPVGGINDNLCSHHVKDDDEFDHWVRQTRKEAGL